ncbi:hypothetical protein [Vagococcus salmoninarum]
MTYEHRLRALIKATPALMEILEIVESLHLKEGCLCAVPCETPFGIS